MKKIVLVVAAHSDDEALGCAGTVARHVASGDIVHAVFMADGVSSRSSLAPGDLVRRMKAAKRAHNLLGLRTVKYLDFPDNRMDSVPLLEVVQSLEPLIQSIAPSVVYTHHHGDLNVDHRVTHHAVLTACRPQPSYPVREIYGFEVLSSTEWAAQPGSFLPQVYVDIGDFLKTKKRVLQAYKLEMRSPPHSRSIEHAIALARHRGNSVGMQAAEAFVAIRVLK